MRNNLKTIALVGILIAGFLGLAGIYDNISRTEIRLANKQIISYQTALAQAREDYTQLYDSYKMVSDALNQTSAALSLTQGQLEELKANPTEQIVYQDRIIEKPVPQVLSDWQSLDELTQFLKDDQTDKAVFFSLVTGKAIRDCDDYAVLLRDHAAQVGKYISLETISPAEYVALENRPWYSNPQDRHMLNSAIVNGRLYLIEPQTDEVWAKESLD